MKKHFGKRLLAFCLSAMLCFGAVPEEALGRVFGGAIAAFLSIVPQSMRLDASAEYINYNLQWINNNTQARASAYDQDSSHDVSETVNTTYQTFSWPTCTTNGSRQYSATFTAVPFDTYYGTQTKTVTLYAYGHSWGTPTYTWSEDNKTVTATRVCSRDRSHTETETVETTYEETTAATCEEKGEGTYTATFKNAAFAKQTKQVEIEALGHEWGEPEYEWSEDNKTVTATRVCKTDETHTETETAEAAYEETTAATCEEKGEGVYTVKFENEAFTTQTKTEETEAAGHTLEKVEAKEATYEEDGNTEHYVCTVCGKLFEDAEGRKEITHEATVIPRITRRPGDVNRDGKVNIIDVMLIQQYIVGWNVKAIVYTPNADVNGDDKINIIDVMLIQQSIAGWKVTLK